MNRTGIVVALAVALLVAPAAVAEPINQTLPTPINDDPAALWVGDSYTFGAGSTSPWKYGEARAVSRAFGWRPEVDAIGGTGFVAPSKYGPPIPARLHADEALRPKPSFVVIDGGRNDHGSLATETQAVTSYFDAVARAFPHANVVVIAPFIMRSLPSDYAATRCLLEKQAVTHGWSYVDPLAQGWIGPSSALLVASGGVHPNNEGYVYLENHFVPAIAEALLTPGVGPRACG